MSSFLRLLSFPGGDAAGGSGAGEALMVVRNHPCGCEMIAEKSETHIRLNKCLECTQSSKLMEKKGEKGQWKAE